MRAGFKAVPQLRISLTYDIPATSGQRPVRGGLVPAGGHNPFSDHDDFANVSEPADHEPPGGA
ncbi:hypothetical protein K7G98_16275 [Saccharothrix sp. MB29]|nr:hypothetical protein [Saccharothrix sp. MB29]